jgi:phosphate uptake regulator
MMTRGYISFTLIININIKKYILGNPNIVKMGSDHRKIMSLGKTSTVISIPRRWLEINGLEKGSLVNLTIQSNGTLLVSSVREEPDSPKEIRLFVEPSESGDSVIRRIVACFLDGYNKLILTSNVFSAEQQRAIRSIVSILYMMVEESEAGRVVLRSLVDDSKTSISSCVERMHAITSSMCRDLLRAISEGKPELAKSVVSIEGDVDQLAFLVFRLIRVAAMTPSSEDSLGVDHLDCLDFQTLVHRVERIADDVEVIAANIAEMLDSAGATQQTMLSSISTLAGKVFNHYNMAVNGFLAHDLTRVNEVIEYEKHVDEVIKDLYAEFTETRNGDDAGNSRFISKVIITDSLRKIAHYSSDIAELTINREYKPLAHPVHPA